MSEGAIGMLVLTGLSVLSACVCHALIRRYFIATVVAAPIASFVFLVAATVQLGYMDPFAPIAFVTASGLAFVIAIVVGLPFLAIRSRRA